MPIDPTAVFIPARLLVAAGEALYGDRWKYEMARALEINSRTVQRWAEAARAEKPYPVSRPLLEAILGLIERRTRPARDAFDHLKLIYDGQA